MTTTYAIVAGFTHSDDSDDWDWKETRHVPTFYLDSRTQGIVSAQHAEVIARDVLDPFRSWGDDLSIIVTEV